MSTEIATGIAGVAWLAIAWIMVRPFLGQIEIMRRKEYRGPKP